MAHNPTMVVGIGEAGTKIASTLFDDLEEIYEQRDESFTDEFAFIGIDSQENDLEDFSRDGFQTIKLAPEPATFRLVKSEHDYLVDNHEINEAGGATRQRAVSRYFIDNPMNYDDFYRELEDKFKTFAQNTSKDGQMNVWVVNSLGGGTGSGAFPLVAAIISEAIATKLDRSLWIGGIGSLPRLEKLEASPVPPTGDDTLYANAYAAIRELSVLLNYDFDDKYTDAAGIEFPFTLPVYSDVDQLTDDEGIRLESPPFDFYTLMGIEEGTSDDSLANLNRIAADTMLHFSELGGIEDIDSDIFSEPPDVLFCSVTGAHARVPVDEIRPYLSLKDEIEDIETELRDTRKKINLHRINRDILRELEQYAPGEEPTVEPEVDTTIIDPDTGEKQNLSEKLESDESENEQEPVDNPPEDDSQTRQLREVVGMNVTEAWDQITDAYETASQTARNFNSDYTPKILDEEVQDSLLENSASFTSDLKIDSETVYKYLYFQELLADYRERRNNHSFRDEITDEWEDKKEDIKKNIEEIDDVDIGDINRLSSADDLSQHELAISRWEDVLSHYHEFRIDKVESALDNTRIFQISKKKKLGNILQERENSQQTLQNKFGPFTRLHEAVTDLEARREEMVRTLTERQKGLDTTLRDELNPEYERLQEKRETKTATKNSKEAKLKKSGRSRFASFKMKQFSKFTPSLLDNSESVIDLENAGIVSAREIIDTIEHIDEKELTEPMVDREELVVGGSRTKYDGGLVAEEDKEILQGELKAEQESVSLNAQTKDFQSMPTQFRIRLIRLFFGVNLENSSEFGTMHDKYTADEDVASQFGGEMSDDEFITEAFAYPELFPDDDEISDHFGINPDNLPAE